jgi:hypothetical protein
MNAVEKIVFMKVAPVRIDGASKAEFAEARVCAKRAGIIAHFLILRCGAQTNIFGLQGFQAGAKRREGRLSLNALVAQCPENAGLSGTHA